MHEEVITSELVVHCKVIACEGVIAVVVKQLGRQLTTLEDCAVVLLVGSQGRWRRVLTQGLAALC
jgi:hypothetical protein